MNFGEQERLYEEIKIKIEECEITAHTHKNGIIFVQNTSENVRMLKSLPISSIQKKYTIVEENEEEGKERRPGTYWKSILIMKEKKKGE